MAINNERGLCKVDCFAALAMTKDGMQWRARHSMTKGKHAMSAISLNGRPHSMTATAPHVRRGMTLNVFCGIIIKLFRLPEAGVLGGGAP